MADQFPKGCGELVKRSGRNLAIAISPDVEESIFVSWLTPEIILVQLFIESFKLLSPKHVVDHQEALKIEQIAFSVVHIPLGC